MLEGYDKKTDRLFNNAFKTVETRAKEAEKQLKAKRLRLVKQVQSKAKQSALILICLHLYENNPSSKYNDWKVVGKKHGSPVRLIWQMLKVQRKPKSFSAVKVDSATDWNGKRKLCQQVVSAQIQRCYQWKLRQIYNKTGRKIKFVIVEDIDLEAVVCF